MHEALAQTPEHVGFDLRDAGARRRYGPGALRTWFRIAERWGLAEREAATLLGAGASSYRRWRRNPEVTLDIGQMERLSLLLGIYKELEVLLPRAEAADAWIRQPNDNPLFGGQRPLDRMLGGLTEDLAVVRRHLAAARG